MLRTPSPVPLETQRLESSLDPQSGCTYRNVATQPLGSSRGELCLLSSWRRHRLSVEIPFRPKLRMSLEEALMMGATGQEEGNN